MKTVDYDAIKAAVETILRAIGEDTERKGLQGTPDRVARFWKEFIEYDPGNVDVTFEAVQTDQMVIVSGLRVWSLCEHHLVPFWSDISIGYIAKDRVLGLSKLARIAHKWAHMLQIQERLVDSIAHEVILLTKSEDVAVLGRGEHLCMTMRGIRTNGQMITSSMNGAFRTEPETRQEFLSLIGASK